MFELQFRADGTVKNAATVSTTEHQLLDETACAALRRWRAEPVAQNSARLTMTFSSGRHPVTIDPGSEEALRNIPVHPRPTYPLAARLQRHVGGGLFACAFNPMEG